MNPFNSLIHALRDRGGYATNEELAAVRPKLKQLLKASVDIVDAGFATWVEGANGEQELRLTDAALERMAGTELKLTHEELWASLSRGEDFSGRTIYVKRSPSRPTVDDEEFAEQYGDDSDLYAVEDATEDVDRPSIFEQLTGVVRPQVEMTIAEIQAMHARGDDPGGVTIVVKPNPETPREKELKQLRQHAREQLAANGYDPNALVTLSHLEELAKEVLTGADFDGIPDKGIYVIADVKEFALRMNFRLHGTRAHGVELFDAKGRLHCHFTDEDMKTVGLCMVNNAGPLLLFEAVEEAKVRTILRSRPKKPQPQYRDEWNLLIVGDEE